MSNHVLKVLARDKLGCYAPLGAFGKPAYESYLQLRTMLLSELGPRYADYFSKPSGDLSSGELSWSSAADGGIYPWHELKGAEKAIAETALRGVTDGLREYLKKLQNRQTESSALAYASLLEQSLKVPADGNFLMLVGSQPTIVFWGFETQAHSSVDPAAQWLLASDGVTAADPVIAAQNTSDPSEVSIESGHQTKKTWWRWLVVALVVLIALAVLLFGLRQRHAPAVQPISEIRPTPAAGLQPLMVQPEVVPLPKDLLETLAQPERLKRQAQLTIPSGALASGDLSFLEGLWELGRGDLFVYSERPKKPDIFFRAMMRFGAAGTGKAFSADAHRKMQGKKNSVENCSGLGTAETDGKKLLINLSCSSAAVNGLFYTAPLECKHDARGKTVCVWVDETGSRQNAELFRIG